MIEDKPAQGAQVAATEPQYDAASFARKHGLSSTEARRIIQRAGLSRKQADALADRLGKAI